MVKCLVSGSTPPECTWTSSSSSSSSVSSRYGGRICEVDTLALFVFYFTLQLVPWHPLAFHSFIFLTNKETWTMGTLEIFILFSSYCPSMYVFHLCWYSMKVISHYCISFISLTSSRISALTFWPPNCGALDGALADMANPILIFSSFLSTSTPNWMHY